MKCIVLKMIDLKFLSAGGVGREQEVFWIGIAISIWHGRFARRWRFGRVEEDYTSCGGCGATTTTVVSPMSVDALQRNWTSRPVA